MKPINVIRKLFDYFSMEAEIDDFDRIHESITKDVVFKGTNLWILMFAIVVASVGLNMNSTAVIIGAMLISPLMGPINGMGDSIATYDMPLFRKSVKNFTFAVGASLLASTTYFIVSPISTAHSELLARTSPTIYDVLIALFGGLAGIVAISSKQKGNVIPGVAIATALMPPLCTAGYGLATAQFQYFFGAIYLFTINTVFIALSSVAISQILKFPIRAIIEEKSKKKINRYISIVIVLILIPSFYFGWNLVQKERFTEHAHNYVNNVSVTEGNYLLKNEIIPKTRTIRLIYGGATMTKDQQERIREKAADFSLKNPEIIIEQGLTLDMVDRKTSEIENLKAELGRLNLMVQDKERILDSIDNQKFVGQQLFKEINALFPQVEELTFSESYIWSREASQAQKTGIALITIPEEGLTLAEQEKITEWLKKRTGRDAIRLIFDLRQPAAEVSDSPTSEE
jgi:uncharacterized hydrophobic protein (TIGR00271 family)